MEKYQGQLGDAFRVTNTLLSVLPLAGIVITLFMQRHEIKIQHEELELQRGELKDKNYYLPKEFHLSPSGNTPLDYTFSMNQFQCIFDSKKNSQLSKS